MFIFPQSQHQIPHNLLHSLSQCSIPSLSPIHSQATQQTRNIALWIPRSLKTEQICEKTEHSPVSKMAANSFTSESVYSPDIGGQISVLWEFIKAPLIVPLLTICVYICLAMSIMVFMERLYMGIVIVLVKLFWKKPEKRYKWEAMRDDDLEDGNAAFPMVLVQIPMFNEKEVCFFFLILSKSNLPLLYVVFDEMYSIAGLQDINWRSLQSVVACW